MALALAVAVAVAMAAVAAAAAAAAAVESRGGGQGSDGGAAMAREGTAGVMGGGRRQGVVWARRSVLGSSTRV